MSVLIKGMEMPTSCAKCRLFGEYGCPFIGAVGYALTRGERNDDCPLVPVPPHGRLIDADALAEKHEIMAYENGGKSYDFHITAKAWVDNASTIIPSDKEADNG